jgi:hypothetical protein
MDDQVGELWSGRRWGGMDMISAGARSWRRSCVIVVIVGPMWVKNCL